MNLQELLYQVNIIKLIGITNIDISKVAFDSREIIASSLFVAIEGTQHNGHDYISQAIKKGATAIVLKELPENIDDKVTYIQVHNSTSALGIIASNFYGNPSKKIKVVGVTGTNGKTTIVSLLNHLFSMLNVKSGMLSTIENRIAGKVIPSTHTTPDAIQINYLLNKMVDQGCEYCFMEVSSHAIIQERISAVYFDAAVFTNITQDHLDYHNSFSEYIQAKKQFFDSLSKSAFALTNKDDRNGMKMLEGTKASKYTYSLKSVSNYKCRVLEYQFQGMLLNINNIDVWVKLIGEFNAYNMLAVYSVASLFGFADQEILTAMSMLTSVEGRFQYLRSEDNITAIIDYAHTDDALKNIIFTINTIRKDKGQLITVVGCGGNRDKAKRPLMGAIVCDLSDQVILTSDNPRDEDPKSIIEDMMGKLDSSQRSKVLIIIDRKEAIKTACRLANTNDIVLVAGKGHEKYQEIKGEKIPFEDLEEIKKSLNIIKL